MAYTKTYKTFHWKNQTIDGKLVSFVRVRIFPLKKYKLLSVYEPDEEYFTDGDDLTTADSYILSNYSYAIITSGIQKIPNKNTYRGYYLSMYIKIYITEQFQLESLNEIDFLGKSYLLEAIHEYFHKNQPFT